MFAPQYFHGGGGGGAPPPPRINASGKDEIKENYKTPMDYQRHYELNQNP